MGKHIVLLTPGFAADEQDLTCIPVMQHFVLTWQKQFPDDIITVITFQYPFMRQEYLWNGIRVFSAGGKNRGGVQRIFTWLRVMRYFKKLYKKQKVDMIQAFWLTEAALVGKYLSGKYHIPMVATAMGQDCAPGNRYLKLINLKKVFTIALSNFMAGHLYQNSGKKPDTFIRFGESQPMPELDIEKERPVDIVGVGSLAPVKNYGLFIEIIAELKKEYPALVCKIAGNQPLPAETEKIKELIARYGLGDNIELTGELHPADILALMRRSKILLHTSAFEGECLVYPEALACGCHIVCSGAGYIYEDFMQVCETKEEYVTTLKKLLVTSIPPVQHFPLKHMDETVKEYRTLYFK